MEALAAEGAWGGEVPQAWHETLPVVAAGICIQRVYRGSRVRGEQRQQRKAAAAAVQVQKVWRGGQARTGLARGKARPRDVDLMREKAMPLPLPQFGPGLSC